MRSPGVITLLPSSAWRH